MATKKEVKNKKEKDLTEKSLVSLREKLRNLKFKVEGAKSKNVKEVREIKKDIARILTGLNQNTKNK